MSIRWATQTPLRKFVFLSGRGQAGVRDALVARRIDANLTETSSVSSGWRVAVPASPMQPLTRTVTYA